MDETIKKLIKIADTTQNMNVRCKIREMLEDISKEILKEIERTNF